MNPDENNNNQAPDVSVPPEAPVVPETPAASEAPITPEVPVTPEPEAPVAPTENLDQVAADLTNAAANDALETPVETPSAEEAPTTTTDAAPDAASIAPVEAPFTPETPVPEAPVAPEAPVVPETPVMPETPVVPEAPVSSEPPVAPEAPIIPETPAAPEAPAVPETPATPEVPTETPAEESPYSTSASFVGDTPVAEDSEQTPAATSEEENPLVPAEPVPGSIGSALAYSETAPDHAVPVNKPSKFKAPKMNIKLSKENLKLLIAIVGGVALVAVVAVVIFFIISNANGTNKSSNTQSNTNNQTKPTNVVTSLTCTLDGATNFSAYGNVSSGSDQMIAMYTNDVISSYGTTLTLTFADEDGAKAAQSSIRENYNAKIRNAGLTQDPFTSAFDVNGTTLTVTHQAEGADITSSNARILDLYVVKGEPITDIDTLQDTYETDGYTCVEK